MNVHPTRGAGLPFRRLVVCCNSRNSPDPDRRLESGALFVLFEVMILKLIVSLKVTAEAMRANHTNLE